jgi:hypothetical protein
VRWYVRDLVCRHGVHQVDNEIKIKPAEKPVRKPKSIPPQLLKAAIEAFVDEKPSFPARNGAVRFEMAFGQNRRYLIKPGSVGQLRDGEGDAFSEASERIRKANHAHSALLQNGAEITDVFNATEDPKAE